MLSRKERWILAGVWFSILACAGFGVTWIEGRRASEPVTFVTGGTSRGFEPAPKDYNRGLVRLQESYRIVSSARPPVTPYVGCMIPEIVVIEKPAPPPRMLLLPTALYSGRVEMDRATLTWKLSPPLLDKEKLPKQEASPAGAIVIRRVCDRGETEEIAVLDPKATAFEDRDVEPGRHYIYSVLVRGMEGLSVYPACPPVVDKDGQGTVDGTVPVWIKVKLIGGGLEQAILNVESYNPKAGRWETKVTKAAPGERIGTTGWTLGKMRFDRFTLVAEVTDDRFVKREISTKKD